MIKKEFSKNYNFDLIICCSKSLGAKGEVDWILASRIDLAVEILKLNPNSRLLLSGGVGMTADHYEEKFTEAGAMYNYIEENYKEVIDRATKEEDSTGSLEQLCLIKENYILKNNYKNIALVSDEIHILRMDTLFDAVLCDEFNLSSFGSKVNIFGKYREVIEVYESENRNASLGVVKLLPRGDHKEFLRFDNAYRQLRKEHLDQGKSRLEFISPQSVIEFMNRIA